MPDEVAPNQNIKKADLPEVSNVLVDARNVADAVAQLSLSATGSGAAGEADKHPEKRAKAAYAAFMDREMYVVLRMRCVSFIMNSLSYSL